MICEECGYMACIDDFVSMAYDTLGEEKWNNEGPTYLCPKCGKNPKKGSEFKLPMYCKHCDFVNESREFVEQAKRVLGIERWRKEGPTYLCPKCGKRPRDDVPFEG